jgi:hypothetical protein
MAKKEYKEVYAFEVVRAIKEGEKVYALDKQDYSVKLLNDEKISVVLELIENVREDKSDRYLLWTEKETEDEHKD